MAWKSQVLVVANVTADAPELLRAMADRAAQGPAGFTVLMPTPPAGAEAAEARERLAAALERMRAAGLEAEGRTGNCDPMVAVAETWDPRCYDEIIVSTLPMKLSKWMHADLPGRIRRQTGALVTHVVALPARPEPTVVHPEPAARLGVMAPLSVLSWGARPEAPRSAR